jgi:hypothetical protein
MEASERALIALTIVRQRKTMEECEKEREEKAQEMRNECARFEYFLKNEIFKRNKIFDEKLLL